MLLDNLKLRGRTLFRTAFTEVSWWKKRLLQVSVVLAVVGLGLVVWGAVGGGSDSPDWSWTALRGGIGCVLGFLIGAAIRLFLKLGLLLGALTAALLYGLSALGWVELPWSSFGEIYGAIAEVLERESSNLHSFLSGYLPSSGMTGLGVASGITQRPQLDDDDD